MARTQFRPFRSGCAMKVSCTTCGQGYDVKEKYFGKKILCVKCQTKIAIPASETVAVKLADSHEIQLADGDDDRPARPAAPAPRAEVKRATATKPAARPSAGVDDIPLADIEDDRPAKPAVAVAPPAERSRPAEKVSNASKAAVARSPSPKKPAPAAKKAAPKVDLDDEVEDAEVIEEVVEEFEEFEEIEDADDAFEDDDEDDRPRKKRKPEPVSKTKGRKKSRAGSSDSGFEVNPFLIFGVLFLVPFLLGAVLVRIQGLQPIGFLAVVGTGLLVCAYAGIRTLMTAFTEDVVCGVLYLFVPFYPIYYIISRWDEVGQYFLLNLVAVLYMFGGGFLLGLMTVQ